MFIDLHCHTKFSGDNMLEPLDLISVARQRGLDAVCITEHDSFCASAPVEQIARDERFPVFRGVEVNTDKGHILVFGLTDDSWKEPKGYYTKVESIIPMVRACGGIMIPAHPFRTFGAASASNGLFSMDYIAALEVLNGENTESENIKAVEAWEKLAIAGTAGSDCHFAREVGSCATWFEKDVRTLEALITEIKAGRVAPARFDGGGYSRLRALGRPRSTSR